MHFGPMFCHVPICPPSDTQCSHGMCSHPWRHLVTNSAESSMLSVLHSPMNATSSQCSKSVQHNTTIGIQNPSIRLDVSCCDCNAKMRQSNSSNYFSSLLRSSDWLCAASRHDVSEIIIHLSFLEKIWVTF